MAPFKQGIHAHSEPHARGRFNHSSIVARPKQYRICLWRMAKKTLDYTELIHGHLIELTACAHFHLAAFTCHFIEHAIDIAMRAFSTKGFSKLYALVNYHTVRHIDAGQQLISPHTQNHTLNVRQLFNLAIKVWG